MPRHPFRRASSPCPGPHGGKPAGLHAIPGGRQPARPGQLPRGACSPGPMRHSVTCKRTSCFGGMPGSDVRCEEPADGVSVALGAPERLFISGVRRWRSPGGMVPGHVSPGSVAKGAALSGLAEGMQPNSARRSGSHQAAAAAQRSVGGSRRACSFSATGDRMFLIRSE